MEVVAGDLRIDDRGFTYLESLEIDLDRHVELCSSEKVFSGIALPTRPKTY